MPFTPSHAAAVLPLLRVRRLSATALVIGSMAPDFEYFFKLSTSSIVGHTAWGVIYFNIPVTLFLAWIFHVHVKENLIRNLPPSLQRRFYNALVFDFNQYLRIHWHWFLLSAAVGATTHILWDSFTHSNGYFARELPFYIGTFVPFAGVRYPLFYVLQHVSTVAGLLILGVHIYLMPQSLSCVISPVSPFYWFFLAVCMGIVVIIRFAVYSADYNIGNLVVSSISGICIGLVLLGWFQFRDR